MELLSRRAVSGEYVKYMGNTEYAPDSITEELMLKNLKLWQLYKVVKLTKYNGDGNWHYQFTDFRWWFPCKSFNICSYREMIMEKYNLR